MSARAEPAAAKTTGPETGLAELRARLGRARGPAFWTELEALAETGELQAVLQREFPSQAPRFLPDVERREFLRLMGASLGVLGLSACTRQPDEKIVPFARAPEYEIPGRPLYFATAFALGGSALGVLVESHMGRPTKIEGNPDHPSSLGSTDALAQAAILSLYDPDRSHSCLRAGQIDTFGSFASELAGRMEGIAAHEGDGLAVLHAGEYSPTLAAQLARLQARFPRLRLYRWSPLHRDHERAGAELAFGRDVATRYRLEKARVIVALEADFLASGTGGVRHARDFARARTGRASAAAMNRLYAVESSITVSGAMADERLALKPSQIEAFARALAKELGLEVQLQKLEDAALDESVRRFARVAAKDLAQNLGAGVVLAGPWADPLVHALVHAMNAKLRNVGSTVEHTLPLELAGESNAASMRRLVQDAQAHHIDTLVILGGNPAYDAPAELGFAALLDSIPFRVHLAAHVDETSSLCHWHVPEAHFLESWSDARAHDGSVSIVQPLIAPLYEEGGVKSAHELVALLAGEGSSAHDLVRAQWEAGSGKKGPDFEAFWRASLHDGFVGGTVFPALEVSLRPTLDFGAPGGEMHGLELALRPDASVFDGRFANNAWLQELPRPLTRLTWENAALVSPRTAAELELASEDVLEIELDGRTVRAPVWVAPGHADGTLTLHLGYGRKTAGRLGTSLGFDAYALRTSAAPWRAFGAKVHKTGAQHALATVQKHPVQEGRNLARVATFERFKAEGKLAFEAHHSKEGHGEGHDELAPPSLYPGFPYEGYAWGMVIDLNACIGCNACMVACQSENNIPVVGKDQVLNGREMHWIRIDRYYEPAEAAVDARHAAPAAGHAGGDGVTVLHQPVPCMHCENAPCETVCPVGATVHSDEGLNEMVYNRCVGTRYCSNNCPYKVRRFNFYSYTDSQSESLKMGRNPDVTVRSRGVMEKCTYCVQRISEARITAEKDQRKIRAGEIVTACQGACPTQAITFGDINDAASPIAQLRTEPHHYGLLAELGTRPRTTYLAKLRNPNPELHGS